LITPVGLAMIVQILPRFSSWRQNDVPEKGRSEHEETVSRAWEIEASILRI